MVALQLAFQGETVGSVESWCVWGFRRVANGVKLYQGGTCAFEIPSNM